MTLAIKAASLPDIGHFHGIWWRRAQNTLVSSESGGLLGTAAVSSSVDRLGSQTGPLFSCFLAFPSYRIAHINGMPYQLWKSGD